MNKKSKEYRDAQQELAEASLRVRQANDELTDACSALRVARMKVERLEYQPIPQL